MGCAVLSKLLVAGCFFRVKSGGFAGDRGEGLLPVAEPVQCR